MTLGLLVAAYLVLAALSLLAVVLVVVSLPARYFVDEPARPRDPRTGLRRAAAAAARNAVGLVLITLGVALSVPGVPGQGLLTLLAGVMLVDFPGRRRVERRILARPGVAARLNRIRGWFGRPPLVLDGTPTGGSDAGPGAA
jgi:hypothetical protein